MTEQSEPISESTAPPIQEAQSAPESTGEVPTNTEAAPLLPDAGQAALAETPADPIVAADTAVADIPVTDVPAPIGDTLVSGNTFSSSSGDVLTADQIIAREEERKSLHDVMEKILAQRARLRKQELRLEDLAEQMKEQKKRVDAETEALMELIDEYESPGLFNQRKEDANKEGDTSAASETIAAPAPAAIDPTSIPAPVKKFWKEVTLDELGIEKKTLIMKLNENGIKTLGDIMDWKLRGRDLDEIKGLGEAKIKIVDDAVDKYRIDHPEDVELMTIDDAVPVNQETTASDGAVPSEPTESGDAAAPTGEASDAVVATEMQGNSAGTSANAEPKVENPLPAGDDSSPLEISDEHFKVMTMDQLQLPKGEIAIKVTIMSLTDMPYSLNDPIPEILAIAGESTRGKAYIITKSFKPDESVYAMRLLVENATDETPVPGDPYANRKVKYKDKVYGIDGIDTTYFVSDPM